MQKILDKAGGYAGQDEVLENYERFMAVSHPSRFAVIKIGGALLMDLAQRKLIAEDIAALHEAGLYPTVMLGAGPQLDKVINAPKLNGKRYTPKGASSVLLDTVNKVGSELSKEINGIAEPSTGLATDIAHCIPPWWGVLAGTVADPENIASVDRLYVDTKPILTATNSRIIPVLSNVGKLLIAGEPYMPEPSIWLPYQEPASVETFEPINLNADEAGGVIASEIGVSKYIVLTETGGVLDEDGETIISELSAEDAEAMIKSGAIHSGMIPKVQEAIKALAKGVGSAAITSPADLLPELFSNGGKGTLIK